MPIVRPTASDLPARALDETERVFAALSHTVRRHIVLLLAHLGGELPSGYLAKRFAHSWPTTTRPLHVLEAAGLVTVRREGRSCVVLVMALVAMGGDAAARCPSPGAFVC